MKVASQGDLLRQPDDARNTAILELAKTKPRVAAADCDAVADYSYSWGYDVLYKNVI